MFFDNPGRTIFYHCLMALTTPGAKKRISAYPGKRRRIAFRRRMRYVDWDESFKPKEGCMKKLTAIAGLLLVSSLAAAQTATVLTGPFDEALAQAQKLNKLILIDFYSSG
jgi:hypothetical protein